MRICVFCGSSPGRDDRYLAAARAFGALLAERQIGLVYGGATVGLMGALADAALAARGEVFGVIPDALVAREIAHRGLTELFVVSSMHERKAKMAELADAFVALPGGIGTLEELFEVWTWTQLGIYQKPCALLNVGGFYDGLLAFLDRVSEEGFFRSGREALVVASEGGSLIGELAARIAAPKPADSKVLTPDQT